jgi:hypothetical protein
MFWKKKDKAEKSSSPKDIPEFVQKYLFTENKIYADILPFLKVVTKERSNEDRVVDLRIFDPSDAEAHKLNVTNYDFLGSNPNLVIAEGWMDQSNKKADITMKVKYEKPKFFTEAEILQQIESLQAPGSCIFFLMAAGSGVGGPLGRGGAVIRLNDHKDEKKKHKYLVSCVNIIDGTPYGKEMPIYESDKAKELAKWVKDGHKPRFF